MSGCWLIPSVPSDRGSLPRVHIAGCFRGPAEIGTERGSMEIITHSNH